MKQNRRILIVDDNIDIHEDFRKILSPKAPTADTRVLELEAQLFGAPSQPIVPTEASMWEFELEFAEQGKIGLEKMERAAQEGRPFAVIFMDVRMPPGWDGIETTKKIWAKFPYTEVILCTAYSDYSTEDIIVSLGVTHRLLLLKKPFDPVAVKQMALASTSKWNFEDASRAQVEKLETSVQDRTTELNYTIAKLKEANKELDANYKQLQETQALLIQAGKLSALGEMAAGIAHEINNPLAIIQVAANQLHDVLKEDPVDGETARTLSQTIEKTVGRIARITHGLKTFSHDDSGAGFRPASLSSIIEDTLGLCQEKMKSSGIQLKIAEVPSNIEIECRMTQISQVLLNLLNNAVDAISSLPDRWIEINFQDKGEQVDIFVTDSGPGIPAGVREKLFQPFFTTKAIGKGTGLGLSISMGLIQAHGGSFYLDTASKNTRFVISLPKKQAEKLSA